MEIDKNWLLPKLERGVCEATGISFEFARSGRGRVHPLAPSIDRRSNRLGYTKRNCRVVAWAFNKAKGEWGEGVFSALARAYLNNGG